MTPADRPTPQTSIELPPLSRLATISPASIDDEARTVDVVFSTGAAVKRYDWRRGEYFIEKLSLKKEHVRLERLNAGAPVLDTHSGWSLSDQKGVVDDASVDGEAGRATLRLSKRPEVDGLWQDIKGRIVRNVSVGYEVHAFRETAGKDGALTTRTAIDWEPYEISFVPMPADIYAQTRDGKAPAVRTHTAQIVSSQETPTMADTPTTTPAAERQPSEFLVEQPATSAPAQRAAASATPPEANERDLGADQERERVTGILEAVSAARLPAAFARRLIDEKLPLVRAQRNVFEEMARREHAAAPPTSGRNPDIEIDVNGPYVHQRAGIVNALQHRIAPAYFKLEDNGREYRGMTMMDIAKVYLNARGVRTTGMSRMEIAGLSLGLDYRSGYHTTSDFASLLADVARKTLRAAYQEAPQTFLPIARRVTLSDFKPTRRLQLGDAPNLELVKEHAEFTRGTIGEGSETMQLETFGRIFAITRQALVNDDTDAFSRVPMLFGRAARKKESDIVWAQITGNPTMGDGNTLFSTAHGNLQADGDVISIASLSRARLAIRLQTGLDGETQVNVVPRYLIVPPSLETVAEQIVAPLISAQLVTSQNIFAGKLQVIVEPRLEANSSTAWYLAASPEQVDIIEYAYLEGEDGPAIENRVGFDIDGLEIKCRLDFDAAPVDWRGLHKDPGELVS